MVIKKLKNMSTKFHENTFTGSVDIYKSVEDECLTTMTTKYQKGRFMNGSKISSPGLPFGLF